MATTNDKIIETFRHRVFVIEIYVTEDKEYCYPICKKQDGSLIHDFDPNGHEVFEDQAEARTEGKSIVDDFLDS